MTPTTAHSRKTWAIALFAGILLAMRIGIARSGIAASLDGQLRPALLSFALLLAPLWFFGFGLGEWLAQRNSVRGTCRLTGVCKDAVMKLIPELGAACRSHHNAVVRGVRTRRVQCDEV